MKTRFTLSVSMIFALHIGSFTALAQEINDPVKLEIFNRFAANRGSHPEVAYRVAKEYLEKYQKDKDKYTQYIEKWVSIYEGYDRKKLLSLLIVRVCTTGCEPVVVV